MSSMNGLRIAAAAASVAALSAPAAFASCIPMTPAQQRAASSVVFDGTALDGPTATGIQRFRVTRYLKGAGPTVVSVETGFKKGPNGVASDTSVSIHVARGQKWRIFGRGSARRVLSTNVCLGSRRR
jgi:hypothetical protein